MRVLVNTDRTEKAWTPWEKFFAAFINQVFEDDIWARLYFEPKWQETSPDFVLFSKRTWIVLFEIKDWGISKIKKFVFKNEVIADINWEIREFNYDSIRRIQFTYKEILTKYLPSEKFIDKPKISICSVLVFPKIYRSDINTIRIYSRMILNL